MSRKSKPSKPPKLTPATHVTHVRPLGPTPRRELAGQMTPEHALEVTGSMVHTIELSTDDILDAMPDPRAAREALDHDQRAR